MVNLRKPLASWHITSPFGDRIHPVTQNIQFHNGVDLRANEGSSIFAPARSIVEKKYVNSVGGKQIILFHPDQNLYTGYAHLSNTDDVNIGDELQRGSIFAYTGSTGLVTAPHLHFVLKNSEGEYLDPESYDWSTQSTPIIAKPDKTPLIAILGLFGLLFLFGREEKKK